MQIPLLPSPTLSAPDLWSSQFNDFLARALKKAPEERAEIPELLSHPFLRNAVDNWKYLEVLIREATDVKQTEVFYGNKKRIHLFSESS